ncbi:hypothetical protein C8J57DRAFT_1243377 [Mycena rebaudengoi]|nr:hypothetical protein C8J57DRAFT_1243377 [Mycena rebaudengoi]
MFLIDPTSTSPALPKFKFDTGQLSADLLDGSAAQPIFLKRCPLADPQYTPPIATKTRQCHPSFPDGNQTRRISFEKCSLADVRYAPTVSATTRRRTAAFRDGGESDQKLGTAPRLQEATHVDAASSSLMVGLSTPNFLNVRPPCCAQCAPAVGGDLRRCYLAFLDGVHF